MFSNLCSVAVLAAILPGLSSAGSASQRASVICGKKGYDRGNGNFCKSNLQVNSISNIIVVPLV